MANLPTSEQVARTILKVFVQHFGCRAGDILLRNNLDAALPDRGVDLRDLPSGLAYASELGWIEITGGEGPYRLTDRGFGEA